MKFEYIFFITCMTLCLFDYIQTISNTITYEDTSAFSKDAPGFNKPDIDPKFNNIKPILFTPDEDVITGDDSNKKEVGYFWDVKDSDNDLQFTGKARIGNSQYINVVAVDAHNINKSDDTNTVISAGTEDLYHPSAAEKKQFDPQYLVKIGTFMKQNDPTVYVLYGRYLATVFPDPSNVQVIGNDATIPQD